LYDNVNLWFAKDANNNIVTIDEVNLESKDNFYCPMCGSDLIPKAIKSKLITAHFAHIDASKCNGEGMIHFWFKNKFLELGDKFTVVSDKERQYICKEVLVEQSYNIGDKIYRPDVTVLTECGNMIYFEMDYSNKKKVQDYIDIWLELRNIVVEVDIKKLMSRDKIPTFKALFYNGKCFNTKKNDMYYNIIGKYKEEVLGSVDKVDDDLKARIQKLDWFWDDVFRYKKNEVDIEYMVDLIDSIDDEDDNDVVKEILSKPKCNELYKNYLYYKLNIIQNDILKSFDSINDLYKITISEVKKSWYTDRLTFDIEFYDLKENSCAIYDITRYSFKQIKDSITKNIENTVINKKNKDSLEFAKNNINIINAINNINNKYKSIDNSYYFYNRFGYERNVNFCYNLESKIDFRLPEDIVYSNSEKDIENYMVQKIEEYMDTVEPFFDHNIIIELLNELNLNYIDLYYKQKNEHTKKIGRKKTITYFVTDKYNYKIKYKIIAEDCIRINIYEIKNDSFDRSIGTDIYLYKNKLYRSNNSWDCFSDKYESEMFNNKSDINKLKLLLINEINKIIYDHMDCVCLDCNKNFKLKIGEFNFYVDKRLQFPRRCKNCREKRKLNKEEV